MFIHLKNKFRVYLISVILTKKWTEKHIKHQSKITQTRPTNKFTRSNRQLQDTTQAPLHSTYATTLPTTKPIEKSDEWKVYWNLKRKHSTTILNINLCF